MVNPFVEDELDESCLHPAVIAATTLATLVSIAAGVMIVASLCLRNIVVALVAILSLIVVHTFRAAIKNYICHIRVIKKLSSDSENGQGRATNKRDEA